MSISQLTGVQLMVFVCSSIPVVLFDKKKKKTKNKKKTSRAVNARLLNFQFVCTDLIRHAISCQRKKRWTPASNIGQKWRYCYPNGKRSHGKLGLIYTRYEYPTTVYTIKSKLMGKQYRAYPHELDLVALPDNPGMRSTRVMVGISDKHTRHFAKK